VRIEKIKAFLVIIVHAPTAARKLSPPGAGWRTGSPHAHLLFPESELTLPELQFPLPQVQFVIVRRKPTATATATVTSSAYGIIVNNQMTELSQVLI
jgi:hypothetical protein